MSAILTMSGATVSAAVLALNVRTWWKSKREFKDLTPFAGGLIQGASCTLCVGGLLGWVAVKAADAGATAGDWGVNKATGKSGSATLAAGSMGTLTPAGACMVVGGLVVGGVLFRAAGKEGKRRIVGGVFVGMTLTATAGFAQIMQWLPDAYNSLGGGVVDMLNGSMPL